jgi:hypothetical protein
MKYKIYLGNPRIQQDAKKLAEVKTLNEALDELARQRNDGKEAYIVEVPEKATL